MSNTRRATNGLFHQSRFASSPAFVHGLACNLVGMVTGRILADRPADRELVWFVQWHSHQPGGLTALADSLIARYPERFETAAMIQAGTTYDEDKFARVRASFPKEYRAKLPLGVDPVKILQGELDSKSERISTLRATIDSAPPSYDIGWARDAIRNCEWRIEDIKSLLQEAHQSGAKECSAAALQQVCIEAAQAQDGADASHLKRVLAELCLNPEWNWPAGGPWYFPRLVETLFDFMEATRSDFSGLVETSVTQAVRNALDYTSHAGGLSLLTTSGNVGARFAAEELCRRQPGRVRIVDVPPSNDNESFIRAIGFALGGNFSSYKNVQIVERIEPILQGGEITLVLTSAQNLWPQMNLREAFPKRLAWLMSQTEKGASVCLLADPQFFMQKRSCEKSGWNSPEFANRIGYVEALPESLTVDELTAIAQRMLPGATADSCEQIAVAAVACGRDLAFLKMTVKHVEYIVARDGRCEPTCDEIETALGIATRSVKLLDAQLKDNDKAPAKRAAQTPRASSRRAPAPAPAPAHCFERDALPASENEAGLGRRPMVEVED